MVVTSVIIPALNEAENLANNLPKVKSQLGPADELIVVDNDSSDDTARVASDAGAEVVHEAIRDRSRARNAGINRSSGQFVVFIDADCSPNDGWLAELLQPFGDLTVGCVAGEIHNIETGTPFSAYLVRKGHLAQSGTLRHTFLPYAQTGNVAYRRAVLDYVGLFDEELFAGHDADLSWRMQLQTHYKIVPAPMAVVNHRQDLRFSTFLRQKRRHAHGAVLLWKKYREYRQNERASFKQSYWEYRSILKRGLRCVVELLATRAGLNIEPNLDQRYQLLIEIGEKLGRIEGSIRNRVWYL